MVVNPIESAYDGFLWLFNAIPQPFQALVMLSCALFVISTVVHIVFR